MYPEDRSETIQALDRVWHFSECESEASTESGHEFARDKVPTRFSVPKIDHYATELFPQVSPSQTDS